RTVGSSLARSPVSRSALGGASARGMGVPAHAQNVTKPAIGGSGRKPPPRACLTSQIVAVVSNCGSGGRAGAGREMTRQSLGEAEAHFERLPVVQTRIARGRVIALEVL